MQVRNPYEQIKGFVISTMSRTGNFRISESAQYMVFVALCGFFARALSQPPIHCLVRITPFHPLGHDPRARASVTRRSFLLLFALIVFDRRRTNFHGRLEWFKDPNVPCVFK
jgi:hypothetical protein